MSVTAQDLQRFKAQLLVFGAILHDVTVKKVDDPDNPFVVKGHIGIRSTSSPLRNSIASNLTGGADQDTYVCIFLADHWDAVSPNRHPKKGDIVEGNGMRFAIKRTISANPGGINMVYKSELKG